MEILVILVIWLGCGVVGAMIMSGRGRSGCGGFALGVLLGPIGLIIALLVRPSEEHEAERQLEIERLKERRQQAPRSQNAPHSSSTDVFVTKETTPDGEVRYRWECDQCGHIGEWELGEQNAERLARDHRCRRIVRRRIERPVEREQTFPDGVVLEAMRTHSRWMCHKCGQAGLWTDQHSAQRDALRHSCD